ncbi:putative RRD2-activator of the phosphotyrosyl phosphatase activity of PP2A [Testicularia cyperi]|uniref:Serine/threonine-protein phosphatase 2A activator n=1 Tax=Testicularia cyperi TaxID=1882483 RepID=A0A317XJL9_9BASI|nr:putative RRD2-activator of the phosphotyrosyl phosphatase activity of PP2A [Testicularia cyperi]
MTTAVPSPHVSESAKDVLIAKLKQPTGTESSPSNVSSASMPSIKTKSGVPQAAEPLPSVPKSLSTTSICPQDFQEPRKRIVSPESLKRFERSESFAEILAFIQICNDSVVGKTLLDEVSLSPASTALLSILEQVKNLRDSTPADTSGDSSRFGNPAFRTFYAKIRENNDRLHRLIPGLKGDSPPEVAARKELSVYFQESWGNEKRIDYGSGMELNMACWLLCLCKLQILKLPEDGPALVLKVFWQYIQVMRDIQSTYWLEPAGSHGVWGLDDYHFLPFLWGAAQLSSHRHLRPKSIHDSEILEEFASKFMYLACIQFINSVKTASLRWHSPMLDDISGVKTWSKVNEGMIKMYKAEVLLKLPIAQHIFFGSLIQFPAGDGQGDEEAVEYEEDEHGHLHPAGKPHAHGTGEGQAAGWGDCCGIPIPSAFAAAAEEKKKLQGGSAVAMGERPFGSNVRRIPFD